MNKLNLKLIVLLITIIIVSSNSGYSQSVAITDNDTYTPDESAMLDVMSSDKGMLVPRMITDERLAISSPATGLLVYDIDFNNFFYYNGLIWMSFSQVGSSGTGGPLFHVVNSYGDTIFAVYDDGVQIIIPIGVKGKVGGFAVSGRSPSKEAPDDYLVITPDSARIYVNDTVSAKGKVGGFAVSGRSPSKGTTNNIFLATVDSTRIYVDESGSKGKVGGFAVSGRSPSKATTNSFLNLSSKNYFIGHRAGESITTGIYNTFIGYEAGMKSTWGDGNMFIGFNAGTNNVDGEENIFIGNEAGLNFTGVEDGEENIYIGNDAGYNCISSSSSVFIGTKAGYNCSEESTGNTFVGSRAAGANGASAGDNNTFIGESAGMNSNGNYNVYVGAGAAWNNPNGENNTFVGSRAGRTSTGSGNVFIGYEAGYDETGNDKLYIANNSTTTLIYGDFTTGSEMVRINGDLHITGDLTGGKSLKSADFIFEKYYKLESIDEHAEFMWGNKHLPALKGQKAINADGYDMIKRREAILEELEKAHIYIEQLHNRIKNIELEESDNTNDKINLLIEENKKLKQDIDYIKELLKSVRL